MAWFIVYMKTVHSKWPLELFAEESPTAPRLETLAEIKSHLKKNGKIFYRDANKHAESVRMTLYKSQVTSVTGPIFVSNEKKIALEDVMTLNEAVEKWKTISKVDTIRKAIFSDRFFDWEVRKSGATWLVTKAGMTRVFGPEDEYEHPGLVVQQLVYNDGDPYWDPQF